MFLNAMMFAVGVAIFGLVFFVVQLIRGRPDVIGGRLASEADGNGTSTKKTSVVTEALAAQIPQLPVEAAGLETELRRAGDYRPTARKEFLAGRTVMIFATLALTAVFLAFFSDTKDLRTTLIIVVGGLAVAGMAYGVPRLILVWQGNRRIRRIERGLPDALDMLTMCVIGGLSLRDALIRVSRELNVAHPDLAMELEIIRQQADIGSLDQAFRQFAQRIDTPEVRSMAALVTQTNRLGTNVAMALRDSADNLRLTRRQRADERANRTSIKMLFPLVFCLAPSVFIILWGPALVELRNFFRQESIDGGPNLRNLSVEATANFPPTQAQNRSRAPIDIAGQR